MLLFILFVFLKVVVVFKKFLRFLGMWMVVILLKFFRSIFNVSVFFLFFCY